MKDMKVLLVNGSSRKNGCTNVALQEVARALQEEGIATEFFFVGNQPLPDCIACHQCSKTGECVFQDRANELAKKAKSEEGLTPEEMVERDLLRQEYIAAYRDNLVAQLENTIIVEPDGTRHKLGKKP